MHLINLLPGLFDAGQCSWQIVGSNFDINVAMGFLRSMAENHGFNFILKGSIMKIFHYANNG